MLKDSENITQNFSIARVNDLKVVEEMEQWPFAKETHDSLIEPPGVTKLPNITEKLRYLQNRVFVSARGTPKVAVSMFQKWKSNDSNKNTEENVFVALRLNIAKKDETYVINAKKFPDTFRKFHQIAFTTEKSPSIWSEIPRIFPFASLPEEK